MAEKQVQVDSDNVFAHVAIHRRILIELIKERGMEQEIRDLFSSPIFDLPDSIEEIEKRKQDDPVFKVVWELIDQLAAEDST